MPKEIGSRRSVPERVIDTWIYKVKDVEVYTREYVPPEDRKGVRDERPESERYQTQRQRITNKVVTIKVELHKTTRQSEEPPHPTEDVHFEVRCAELNLHMKGTDIEALRASVWEHLDKHFEIKWEQYYLVEVKQNRPWGGASGTGILFEYDDVWKGTTWDGKLLLKKYEGHEYKIKVWPGEFTDKGGNVIACIPHNDTNTKALEEFARRMNVMQKLMADFLRPDKILNTLANLSGAMPFLPPVPEEETRGTKSLADELEGEPRPRA